MRYQMHLLQRGSNVTFLEWQSKVNIFNQREFLLDILSEHDTFMVPHTLSRLGPLKNMTFALFIKAPNYSIAIKPPQVVVQIPPAWINQYPTIQLSYNRMITCDGKPSSYHSQYAKEQPLLCAPCTQQAKLRHETNDRYVTFINIRKLIILN